jgi:DNA-binding PadR family transcriptional regulator
MEQKRAPQRSPLAMVILSLLAEEPMHPYRIQQLIKSRGKDEVVNVARRNSVYQTLNRVLRDGYIQVAHTSREPGRPERTVYELTEAGRAAQADWLRGMLSTPAREFPEFPAALAFVMLLEPEDARRQLDQRSVALQAKLDRIAADFDRVREFGLPRLFIIENEYDAAVTRAELNFVRDLVNDLETAQLTWSREWLAEISTRFEG